MPAVTYIDESLIQLLLADAGVVAIAGTRIYSTQAPQGTAMPCIVFTRETQGRGPYMHMSGMTGLIRATYTVSALGESLIDTRNLGRAVRVALQYKRTATVRLAVVKNDDDLTEPQGGGEQLPIYRTDIAVEITYTES
jgi:hypothetical protein